MLVSACSSPTEVRCRPSRRALFNLFRETRPLWATLYVVLTDSFTHRIHLVLAANCNHIFCISCLKSWRDPSSKSADMVQSHVHKKCPMCRAPSAFVTPSSVFYQSGDKKEQVMRAYKESMARVGCRYFIESKLRDKQKPFCPFGRDCFYQHLNDDGTPYVFREGVKACMRVCTSLPSFYLLLSISIFIVFERSPTL